MRSALILLSFIAASAVCRAQDMRPYFITLSDQDKKDYVLHIDERAMVDAGADSSYNYDHRKYHLVLVPVSLTNNSRDTLKYVNMRCNWQIIYGANRPDVSVFVNNDCFKNGPEVIKIPPYGSLSFRLPVLLAWKTTAFDPKFRISMNVQKYTGRRYQDVSYALNSENNIWSNEVEISK